MNVLFGTGFSVQPKIIEHFKNTDKNGLNFIVPENYNEETLLKYAPETDILIKESVSKEFLGQAPNLKHIQIPWTGSDRINFELLRNYPNVTVANSHSNSLTIAEHAVALLFAVAKQINYRDSYMRKGDWHTRYERKNNSFPLVGKTVGIIGYGAIGQKTAKMLKHGFDMKVLAVKRNPNSYSPDGVYDYLGGIDDISKVLQESDFIIVAVPLTDETKGLIGKKQFNIMKDGAIIINIARGPIIDEEALYEFLKAKRGYAGIDVWYNYPERQNTQDPTKKVETRQNYPFEELENIIMSPHSAFKVGDIGMKTAVDIIKNLELLSEGSKPINILNHELGY